MLILLTRRRLYSEEVKLHERISWWLCDMMEIERQTQVEACAEYHYSTNTYYSYQERIFLLGIGMLKVRDGCFDDGLYTRLWIRQGLKWPYIFFLVPDEYWSYWRAQRMNIIWQNLSHLALQLLLFHGDQCASTLNAAATNYRGCLRRTHAVRMRGFLCSPWAGGSFSP